VLNLTVEIILEVWFWT